MSILPRDNLQRGGWFGGRRGWVSGILSGLAVGFIAFYLLPARLGPGLRLLAAAGIGTVFGILRCKIGRFGMIRQ